MVQEIFRLFIQKLGLTRINIDHTIFVSKTGLDGPVVSTFIDKIKIMAPKENKS